MKLEIIVHEDRLNVEVLGQFTVYFDTKEEMREYVQELSIKMLQSKGVLGY